MSSSDYRLNLVWTSHGEQLRADIERNIGQLVGWDNQVRRSNTNLGLWGQQMRAVGTTIRYALAGATVYGVVGAVQGLGQFLDRLGQIDSLAGQMDRKGTFQGLGRQLNEVGDMAIDLSDKWGTAVDDIQQHMVRFYSSFGDNVRGRQGLTLLREYSAEMQRLSMIAEGADPQALAGGVAGLVIGQTPPGQRPNPKQFGRMTDIIARVLQETPTITGTDIARDVGRLSAATIASNMTPEQVFAVYGLAARAGGSGAVIGRGVSQLLTSELIRPQTDAQKKAFRRVGLPTDPTALHDLGGIQILRRMMAGVAPNGATFANRMALGDESLDDETAITGAGARGINLTLASQLFGRQESFRQFLNLMANGGVTALQNFVNGINEAERVRLGAQMADARNRERTYQQFAQTQRNLGLQLARGFDPIMRPAASAATRAGQALTNQGGTALAGEAAALGGSAIAARLIFGTSLIGGLGKGLSKIPGVGKLLGNIGIGRNLARNAPALSAATLVGSGLGAFNATGEGQTRSGSRSNPYWVVIDPLSWFMPGAPNANALGGEGGGGGGTRKPPVVPAWLRRLSPGLRSGGVAAAVLATPIVAQMVKDHIQNAELARGDAREVPGGHPLLAALSTSRRATGFSFVRERSPAQQRIIEAFLARRINADVAERRLAALHTAGRSRETSVGGTGFGFSSMLAGEAGVTITLQGTPELEAALRDITKTRYHVPVKLWPRESQQKTFRGQPKTQRGSGSGR